MAILRVRDFQELMQLKNELEMPKEETNRRARQKCVNCRMIGRCANLDNKDWCEVSAANAIIDWVKEVKGIRIVQVR